MNTATNPQAPRSTVQAASTAPASQAPNTQPAAPAPKAAPKKEVVTATLVVGRYYDYKGLVFDASKPGEDTKVVNEAQEAYLREVYEVTNLKGREYRHHRFKFSNDKK